MEIIGVGSVRAPVAGLLEHALGFGRHLRLALRHSPLGRSGTPTHAHAKASSSQIRQLCEIETSRSAAAPAVTHKLSGWVLDRPFRPSWPSGPPPPPSGGGSMRLNINGVRFCVGYTTWPAGWHHTLSGMVTGRKDALAARSHTGAPSARRWRQVFKAKSISLKSDLSVLNGSSKHGSLVSIFIRVT